MLKCSTSLLALACLASLAVRSSFAADVHADSTESEVVLERVPPTAPDAALATLEIADGFQIEQVAAEPLVVDPVAMAFDEHGRLYVVEMRDYSEQDQERLGRVRLLTDEDHDGQFDKSQVFADGLSWPTAVICYDGGVFIGNAPDILYLKDTTGDGVADERRVVFTGFGRGNVQGLVNSFQWGLDHRIHGATSSAGGQITRPGREAAPLDLRGRDFAFDPKTLEIEATTGGGQHGLTFNRWGDRFVCHNSDHLQAIVFEERYLARNPYQSVVSARRSIAADGPQAAVYRASPVEAWRVARTKMRLSGRASGPIEGGGRAAGYFTSATGVTVYEADLWDTRGASWVLVADVGSNLIHRKRLVREGVTYRGQRMDEDTEFVRSTDIWFRPVQMAMGPEGALYVADMYREVIEHPASLPPELKRQLDLTSGNDRGRIYRIVPAGFRDSAPRPLASADTCALVQALDDANAWRRATASRLLYERQDPAAVRLLRAQLRSSGDPAGRIAMLYAIQASGALRAADVMSGLSDPHPQVRRHALRLAEPLLNSSLDLTQKVLSLAGDNEPVVRFQLALTLGECSDPAAAQALAKLMARYSDEPDIIDAALTSINSRAGRVLQALLQRSDWTGRTSSEPVVAAIVAQIARQRREEDLDVLLKALQSAGSGTNGQAVPSLLKALSRLPADALRGGGSPQLAELERLRRAAATRLIHDAERLLQEDKAGLEQRLAAIASLGLDRFENQRGLLEELLSASEPAAIHAAVLATCTEYDAPEVAELVLEHWQQFAPAERAQTTELLLRRRAWTVALLRHMVDEAVPLASLEPGHVARLENYPSSEVRRLTRTLRGRAVPADRQQLFEEYREMALAGGDPSQGKPIFEKNCATCHSLSGGGQAVGPNLAAMVSRGAESMLLNILAPSGEVEPRFLEYVVLTSDGQVHTGMIAGETSTAVTLRGADNKTTTILRVDIDDMQNTGKSLMPEGFEKVIDKRAMADLLAYIQQAAAAEEPGAESRAAR